MSQTKVEYQPARTETPVSKRARLFLVLFGVLFAIWVGAMVWMYLTTVYPHPVHITPPVSDKSTFR